MEQKQRFVSLAGSGHFTITELCRDFGISRTTGHKWLSRHAEAGMKGLEERRRRGAVFKVERGTLTVPERPDHVFGVDFKGWFLTGDLKRCDPLTVTDLHSRFILKIDALEEARTSFAMAAFRGLFRRRGLPEITGPAQARRQSLGPASLGPASLGPASGPGVSPWISRYSLLNDIVAP